ncbi:MAG: succinate dehydrogenase cytochrome b subunit [Bdellovibrionales bacterium]|nr:succinate dehydrogenase cytochrome b subunit [Bdellovibrionales bacterium]
MSFFTSTIGRKFLMAITGIGLMAFVLAHMLGNLQIFMGPETFNGYAEMLRSMPGLLWTARLGLLAFFVVHIVTAFSLTGTNRGSRVHRYAKNEKVQASLSSLYMLETGLVVLLFVLLHLAHFTFGFLQPEIFTAVDAAGRHDVYSIVIYGFQHVGYSVFYLFCVFMLGCHLHHGFQSVFQTLGFNHPVYSPLVRRAGTAFAAVIFLGYASIPLSVLAGVLG